MKTWTISLSLAVSLFAASVSSAAILTGTVANGDAVTIFSFQLTSPGPLKIQTYQFGGGTDSAGNTVAALAFDSLISLFSGLDSDPSAPLLEYNDDGDCPPGILNPYCGDSTLSILSLPAGDYFLAVSASGNLPNGPTFGAGFTGGGLAGGDFHIDLVAVPEPRTVEILAGLLLGFAGWRYRRRLAWVAAVSTLYAADLTVPSGGSLQAAIDAAQPGDRILLAPGAVYRGNFEGRLKTGSQWITITTQGFAVPPGVRVSPADRTQMAALVTPNGAYAIGFQNGVHHYRLIGLEIRPDPNVYSLGLVMLGNGAENTVGQIPSFLEVDRCYIHGDLNVGTKRAIAANAQNIRVLNSYISDIASDWQDTNAICGWSTPGPIQITNNFLEATGVNVLFGGAPPAIPGMVPADIDVRRNHISKSLTWKVGHPTYAGRDWIIKYLFELKSGRRVTLEGNVLERAWNDNSSNGRATGFGPLSDTGPLAVVEDVLISRNIFRDIGNAFLVYGMDAGSGTGVGRRVTIRDNIITELLSSNALPGYVVNGTFFDTSVGPDDLTVEHNTVLSQGTYFATFRIPGYSPTERLRFENNIIQNNQGGIYGDPNLTGLDALNSYAPGAIFQRNVIQGGNAAQLGPLNFYPGTVQQIGFANPALNDLRLRPDSPFYKASSAGRDLGADVWAVLQATQGVVSGTSARCASGVSPASLNFPAAGGPGTLTVTAPAGCAWYTAIPNGWPTLTSGFSGSGSGSVTFQVPALPAGVNSRSTSLNVAAWKVIVNQTR